MLSPSYITNAAASDATVPLTIAETAKNGRHLAQCKAAGFDYFSAIFTVMGGVTGSFLSDLVQPTVRSAVAAAKRNHENEWEVRLEHQRYLDSWSIRIARGNARLIRSAQPRLRPSSRSPFPE